MDGAGGNDTLIVNHGHPEIAVVNIGYFNALNPFTGGRDGRMWGGYGYVDYQ